jgi:hypothetical protein
MCMGCFLYLKDPFSLISPHIPTPFLFGTVVEEWMVAFSALCVCVPSIRRQYVIITG